MKGRSIPGSLGRHKPQAGRGTDEIRTDEMAHRRPPLHANLLRDIKAVAIGIATIGGVWRFAWCPDPADNYVPIKFNDCPLFRSAKRLCARRVPCSPPLPLSVPVSLSSDYVYRATPNRQQLSSGSQSNYFLILSGWVWNRAAFAERRATTL